MAVIKCKMCGGDLVLIEGQSVAECEYCGSRQTVPVADNEKKLTLFARANRLRAACEFDKAAGIYETIVADFPEEAEAYWGLVLCKYGIEYVDDPATGKKIPTCHRSSFDSLMEDSDFEQALENADTVARRVYREEAKQIEELRKGIVAVSSNEAPYDIFICYKETDENGNRTLDSVLAQDIYDALTEKGYRTFFARISLEDKLGQEYEPYIFAALNSAKIMLAVGTDYEFYNAVWVKNEWSRYLKLMEKDKTKYLIPCFKGIDAYDMPREFAKLQAQDLSKVGAMQDLLRGIEKLLPKQSDALTTQGRVVITENGGNNAASLLKRGMMALEDGDWSKADEFFERVLDQQAECAEAYWGKAMTSAQCYDCEELAEAVFDKGEDKYLKRARKYADTKMKQQFAELDRLVAEMRREKAEEEREWEEKKRRQEEEKHRKAEEKEQLKGERQLKLEPLRKRISKTQNVFIIASATRTVGLRSDGTVVAVGDNGDGQCEVGDWTDIVAVSASDRHTVGLRSDGTVVAVGYNSQGQCDVDGWSHIVDVRAGDFHTVGLKSDGTVFMVGHYHYRGGGDWSNIVAVSAGSSHTVGLRSDGTVVAEGLCNTGAGNVSGWSDIVAIDARMGSTVGLKSDGTVVTTDKIAEKLHGYKNLSNIVAVSGNHRYTVGLESDGTVVTAGPPHHDVESWSDIVAVSAKHWHIIGLKSDGTVVASGSNEDGECNVCDWSDIVAVSTGLYHTVGLRSDGTVVAVGKNHHGQCDVSGWKLFDSFDNLEEEIDGHKKRREEEKAKRIAAWRNSGKCQHCGGTFKGLLFKKCTNCDKPKDY